ncbi:NADH-ubiquinone oxidoreductase-F iron-sulfur binding region domain-containing protein [Denitromonas iodatirespirans]|nr:NADH-ubiquinone oxidoreductase-F iron-sulfur binding region domain-containing protein [Denitromonas iodatirespirans]
MASVRSILGLETFQRAHLLEYLHRLQDATGGLVADDLVALAALMGIAPVEVAEVASFYHHFDCVESPDDLPPAVTVRVCDSLACAMAGSEALATALDALDLPNVRIQRVSCIGQCDAAPAVTVGQHVVQRASLENVQTAIGAGALSATAATGIDYAAYRADGGYELLKACHDDDATATHVLTQLDASGLRGLGGAGFPAARKWRIVAGEPAPRYLVVNLDEGEPGTFKDREVLERDPHRMLEGALIAAQLCGCEAIYIYLRDEYAAIRRQMQTAIDALLADPPVPVPLIELRRGAGAYVCGEESALIESLEGKRGMPRLRPPYVAERGLFGRPTLEHNGETLFWVREIAERGGAWFADEGRHGRSGLRRYSVSGRVAKPGVYLAPAGITVRELIDEYAGGMAEGHTLYGYFPGGASGGMLPARLADVPLDFDTLQPHGCFIGSAAVIVFSTADRARDLALNTMRFFAHESCGRCTPCRVGTDKAAGLMAKPVWDAELLEALGEVMRDASICGLGQAAPNAMACAMRYFPEEFADG